MGYLYCSNPGRVDRCVLSARDYRKFTYYQDHGKRIFSEGGGIGKGMQGMPRGEEAQRGPILDGMEYGYLYDQLQKFRSGIRGQNPANRSEYLMGVGVKKLNNDLSLPILRIGLPVRILNPPFVLYRET